MRRGFVALVAMAALLQFAPGHASTVITRLVQIPTAGTYGAVENLANPGGLVYRCRDGVNANNPGACAPVLNPSSDPAHAQKPVTGDVEVERGNLARVQRCLYLTDRATAQDGSSGVAGYLIDVHASRTHHFTLTGPANTDFDVVYYVDLGSCANSTPAGTTNATNASGDYSFSKFGNESGTIPTDAVYAIVTLFIGAPMSSFTYTIT